MSEAAGRSHRPGALSDLRVLDLSQMLAGPICTQVLADHGADVIKIESLAGDGIRSSGPFRPDDTLRAFGGYFQSVNRNKSSIALDLKQDEGKAVFLRMVEEADVVVENFRAGVMDRLGLGYEQLRALKPALVYASVRGFGDPRSGASPYAHWPAYDVVAQAMGGVMSITGEAGGAPTKIGPGVTDQSLYIGLTGSRTCLHSAETVARAAGFERRPLEDLLIFNTAFGKTVPDIPLNAVANLIAAQEASWGPIQFKGKLQDRATYRYFWNVLEQAHATGMALPDLMRQRFFA